MSTSLQQYDEAASRYTQAFAAFSRQYAAMNIAPQRSRAVTSKMDKWLFLGLLLTLIGAIVVSASHTIPVFVGKNTGVIPVLLALATFTMVECGIVTYAFFQIRRSDISREITHVKKLSRRGLLFIMVIALAANVKYVLTPSAEALTVGGQLTVWQVVEATIFIAVAFSAPIIAYISGELLAIVSMYEANSQKRLDEQYALDLSQWNDELVVAWKRDQKNWGVKVSIAAAPMLEDMSAVRPSADTDGQTGQHGYGTGYNRNSDARNKVREYLASTPSAADMPVRELATVVGVGKTVAAEVIREWKQDKGQSS